LNISKSTSIPTKFTCSEELVDKNYTQE